MTGQEEDDNGEHKSNHGGVTAVVSADSVVKSCGSEKKKSKLRLD